MNVTFLPIKKEACPKGYKLYVTLGEPTRFCLRISTSLTSASSSVCPTNKWTGTLIFSTSILGALAYP